ncbi:MAG: hypothetical protein EOM55_01005 [Clostridia bacterium]|nr:hypothetical protein [Clostridia bacterium]
MNLFVCVDEQLNILSLNYFKPFIKTMESVDKILENKAVIFDNEFMDYISAVPTCCKIIFDENIKSVLPEFLSPLSSVKEKIVSNMEDLLDYLKRLEDKNIFILGHKLFDYFFNYVDNIYQLNIMGVVEGKDKFMDIKSNQNWKFVMYSEPIYENGKTMFFSHYKRKRDKLEYSQLKEMGM